VSGVIETADAQRNSDPRLVIQQSLMFKIKAPELKLL
jgi:hypothetical protein